MDKCRNKRSSDVTYDEHFRRALTQGRRDYQKDEPRPMNEASVSFRSSPYLTGGTTGIPVGLPVGLQVRVVPGSSECHVGVDGTFAHVMCR